MALVLLRLIHTDSLRERGRGREVERKKEKERWIEREGGGEREVEREGEVG